jgi:hypothetical protein
MWSRPGPGTILGVLLLPLPFIAYKVLKFLLSLGLLYAVAFFLRPCKKLSFTPEVGRPGRIRHPKGYVPYDRSDDY